MWLERATLTLPQLTPQFPYLYNGDNTPLGLFSVLNELIHRKQLINSLLTLALSRYFELDNFLSWEGSPVPCRRFSSLPTTPDLHPTKCQYHLSALPSSSVVTITVSRHRQKSPVGPIHCPPQPMMLGNYSTHSDVLKRHSLLLLLSFCIAFKKERPLRSTTSL